MSFNKKDYLYAEPNTEEDDDDEVENTQLALPPNAFRDRIPQEWVQALLFLLQDRAKGKGVELLDKCTTVRLADFTGKYVKEVWRY